MAGEGDAELGRRNTPLIKLQLQGFSHNDISVLLPDGQSSKAFAHGPPGFRGEHSTPSPKCVGVLGRWPRCGSESKTGFEVFWRRPQRVTVEISLSVAFYNMAVKFSHVLRTFVALLVLARPVNVPRKVYPGFDPVGYGIVTRCQKLLWLPEAAEHNTTGVLRWLSY